MNKNIIYILFIIFLFISTFESTLGFSKVVRWILFDLFVFGFALELGLQIFNKYENKYIKIFRANICVFKRIYFFNILIIICGILSIIKDFFPNPEDDKILDIINIPLLIIVTSFIIGDFINILTIILFGNKMLHLKNKFISKITAWKTK